MKRKFSVLLTAFVMVISVMIMFTSCGDNNKLPDGTYDGIYNATHLAYEFTVKGDQIHNDFGSDMEIVYEYKITKGEILLKVISTTLDDVPVGKEISLTFEQNSENIYTIDGTQYTKK